jgi:hypothetical protein
VTTTATPYGRQLIAQAERLGSALELELWSDADRWVTAYLHGRPFATLERSRVYDQVTPRWQAFGLDGKRFAHARSAHAIVSMVEAAAAWVLALELIPPQHG